MGTAELEFENEFWRFLLGIADKCLALQEALGNDINLLLFRAWRGAARPHAI